MEKLLERPLPKPSTEDYAAARALEALVEAGLALEFVKRGLVRNAAGKAFQAWRALLVALLWLEMEKVKTVAKTEEEKRWLEERAVSRVPTSRIRQLALMLDAAYGDVSLWTEIALNLHDYQYHGPDPDMALSRYKSPEEAAFDVVRLVKKIYKLIEAARPRLRWEEELQSALERLGKELVSHE
ncbi:MAG: PaREP1 family protein [Pyrobaculum sp.]